MTHNDMTHTVDIVQIDLPGFDPAFPVYRHATTDEVLASDVNTIRLTESDAVAYVCVHTRLYGRIFVVRSLHHILSALKALEALSPPGDGQIGQIEWAGDDRSDSCAIPTLLYALFRIELNDHASRHWQFLPKKPTSKRLDWLAYLAKHIPQGVIRLAHFQVPCYEVPRIHSGFGDVETRRAIVRGYLARRLAAGE